MGTDKVCYNCGKKVGAIFSKKCRDQFFCSSCIGKLHSYIVDDLNIFTPDQVNDLIVVSEAKDKMYQKEVLKKILSNRAQYLSWKRADESDRKKLEAEYKRECDSLKREMERDLKEVEREQEEFKKSNHNRITEVQRATMETVKQTIRNNYQKDAQILAKNFELDKAELGEIAKKGSNKFESNENDLNLILWKAQNRARELRRQKEADLAEKQKKAEEIELKKRESEKKINDQQKINQDVSAEAQKQREAELERYKAEVREKERIKAENEARKALERELQGQKKMELRQARKENPVHLAWISLVCSILAWLTAITVLLPIIFITAGLITGARALKSSKRNVAIASIIASIVLVLFLLSVAWMVAINS